jgi:HPt (histidine-containing phosphotransfer) domain-containing protein
MSLKQIFNRESLLHFTEDDRILSAQLLSMALQDIPAFFSNASMLVQKKEYLDAAVWIHKMKGIAGTVGAENLYDSCIKAEIKLKEMNTVTVNDPLIHTMTISIDEFCNNEDVLDWISDV